MNSLSFSASVDERASGAGDLLRFVLWLLWQCIRVPAFLLLCQLGADLLLIYRVRRRAVVLHRIGTHTQLFGAPRLRDRQLMRRPRKSK